MKRNCWTARLLISVLGSGLGAYLPTVALAASVTNAGSASMGRGAVSQRRSSDEGVTVRVSDEVRLAERLGPAGRPRPAAKPNVLATPATDGILVAQRPFVSGPREPTAPAGDEPPARGGDVNARATRPKTAPAPRNPDSRSADTKVTRAKWNAEVEYPLRVRELDRQVTLAKAQLESHQNRLDLYAKYNVTAPPDTPGFTPSSIVPRNPSYTPDTMQEPVRAFSPGSTFSHVLGEVERRAEEAKLQLDRATKERALLVKGGPEAWNRAPAAQAPLPDYALRLQTLEADWKQAQFKHETYDRRLTQFDKLSEYTYSVSFSDLREKLKLGRLEQQLRLDGLQEEKKLLEEHFGVWQRLQNSRP